MQNYSVPILRLRYSTYLRTLALLDATSDLLATFFIGLLFNDEARDVVTRKRLQTKRGTANFN